MPQNGAYVTLLTKTEYLAGALVLHKSLVDVGSRYPLVVMVTPPVPQETRQVLRERGMILADVESLLPRAGVHNVAAHDIRFQDTWTKLRAFGLTEYDRVVLLDSDMIVMRNMDELFDLDLASDQIAAVHACACNPRKLPHYPADWIPENCAYTAVAHPTALTDPTQILPTSPRPYKLLNSGLVVLHPSKELSDSLTHFLETSPLVPTFSFPDQDLLAAYFEGRWKVLPWCYNALKTLREIHKPLWRDEEIRCLHYILHDKPWMTPRGTAGIYEEVHGWWWDRYEELGKELAIADPAAWQLVDAQVTKLD